MRAPDRLCQIESTGAPTAARPAWVDSDGLLRRFRPEDKVGLDRQRAPADTRAMREAFAAGANALVQTTTRWGVEWNSTLSARGFVEAMGQSRLRPSTGISPGMPPPSLPPPRRPCPVRPARWYT